MKNVIFFLVLATISAGVSAGVTCMNYGNMTTCNGSDQNGQPVNTTTSQYGSMSVTNGNMGGQQINTTTSQYGNMSVTSGSIGGQNVQQTCMQYGNMTTCN